MTVNPNGPYLLPFGYAVVLPNGTKYRVESAVVSGANPVYVIRRVVYDETHSAPVVLLRSHRFLVRLNRA